MGKCKDCKFWEVKETKRPQNGVIQGVCHCNPPVATGCFMPKMNMISGQVEPQLIELTVWAITTGISWCGKFEPAEAPLRVPEVLKGPIVTTPQAFNSKRKAKSKVNRVEKCEHEWVNGDNEVVSGAKVCLKCKTIKAKEE